MFVYAFHIFDPCRASADPKSTREIVGHSGPDMTRGMYHQTDLTPERKAVIKLPGLKIISGES